MKIVEISCCLLFLASFKSHSMESVEKPDPNLVECYSKMMAVRKELSIYGRIFDIEEIMALARALEVIENLKTLTIGFCHIIDEGIKDTQKMTDEISEAHKKALLLNNSNPDELILCFSVAIEEGTKTLPKIVDERTGFTKALKNNNTLTRLRLHGMQLDDEKAKSLVKALRGSNKLTSLDLANNPITDEGDKAIQEIKGSLLKIHYAERN